MSLESQGPTWTFSNDKRITPSCRRWSTTSVRQLNIRQAHPSSKFSIKVHSGASRTKLLQISIRSCQPSFQKACARLSIRSIRSSITDSSNKCSLRRNYLWRRSTSVRLRTSRSSSARNLRRWQLTRCLKVQLLQRYWNQMRVVTCLMFWTTAIILTKSRGGRNRYWSWTCREWNHAIVLIRKVNRVRPRWRRPLELRTQQWLRIKWPRGIDATRVAC